MSESILIIENTRKDFYEIKNELTNFDIIPSEYNEYPINLYKEYSEIQKFTRNAINSNHDSIKTIIVDISLKGDTDLWGIELIDYIRHCDSFNFSNSDEWKTLIPIICYTRHDNEQHIKKSAYDKGVTNYFSKNNLRSTGELLLMKQNILFQKHLFNKTLKYNYNDLQVASEILLLTSQSIPKLIDKLNSSSIEPIYESINNLIKSLEEKSQLFSTKIDGVSILIKKESEKANKINKLLVVLNLIMLEESKREIFCRNFASELLSIITTKGYKCLDEIVEDKKTYLFSKLFKSPATQGLSLFSNIVTVVSALGTGISEDDILQLITNSINGLLPS